jgi:hypothetical protein
MTTTIQSIDLSYDASRSVRSSHRSCSPPE